MKRAPVPRKSQDETLISNYGESQVERIDRWPINRTRLNTIFEAKFKFNVMIYSGEDFENEKYASVDFTDISLKFTSFVKCEFSSCNFTLAGFESTSFEDCKFVGCCFSGVDFAQIKIKKCSFDETLFSFTTFQKLKSGSNFETILVDWHDSSFNKCNFSEAIFNSCNLKNVKFEDCDLTRAIFKNCDLLETDLSSAKMDGTTFQNSKIFKTKLSLDGFIRFGNSHGFVLNNE